MKCHYSGKEVEQGNSIRIGGCWPGLTKTYECHPDALPFFKASKRLFDEVDENCNTCEGFKRVKHPKAKGGFLKGQCAEVQEHPLVYDLKETIFWIHPDDAMLMPCYKQRPPKE